MNQKQRDLLCQMIATRTKILEQELNRHFFMGNGSNDRWDIKRTIKRDSKVLETLGIAQRKQHAKLQEEDDRLQEKQKLLNERWNAFYDAIKSHCVAQTHLKKIAAAKLKVTVENAIIEIQFAESANQAKLILESLPTLEQLIR